jgi:hypothetical protein
MSAPLPFYLANAFAPSPHAGNQAAVVIFPDASHPKVNDEAYYKLIARDFNLSETAYLVPKQGEDGIPTYDLRWFTPEAVSLVVHVQCNAGEAARLKRSPGSPAVRTRNARVLADPLFPPSLRLDPPSLDAPRRPPRRPPLRPVTHRNHPADIHALVRLVCTRRAATRGRHGLSGRLRDRALADPEYPGIREGHGRDALDRVGGRGGSRPLASQDWGYGASAVDSRPGADTP